MAFEQVAISIMMPLIHVNYNVCSTKCMHKRNKMIFRHKPNRTYLNIQELPQQHCADELSLLKIPLILSTQVWPYLTKICPKLQHQLQNHKTGRVLVIIYSDSIYIKPPLVNK